MRRPEPYDPLGDDQDVAALYAGGLGGTVPPVNRAPGGAKRPLDFEGMAGATVNPMSPEMLAQIRNNAEYGYGGRKPGQPWDPMPRRLQQIPGGGMSAPQVLGAGGPDRDAILRALAARVAGSGIVR